MCLVRQRSQLFVRIFYTVEKFDDAFINSEIGNYMNRLTEYENEPQIENHMFLSV